MCSLKWHIPTPKPVLFVVTTSINMYGLQLSERNSLCNRRETTDMIPSYAVRVKKDAMVVGRVPRELSRAY